MEILERMCWFRKPSKEKGQFLRMNCPPRMAQMYLQRKKWRIPILRGFVCAPIQRHDGSILYQRGFDAKTGLFLVGQEDWLPVSSKPTVQELDEAINKLRAPFAEFPFATPADESVVHAATLTGLQRRLLPCAPLIGFDAPSPRTGKSLLASIVAIIATGKAAAASAVSTKQEELRKSLLSILLASPAIVNFDNLDHPLYSAELCKILTEEEFQDRILSRTEEAVVPTNVMFTATGNNLSFRGDLSQRAVICRINANEEHPEEREFQIPDLKSYVLQQRKELVHAALTLLAGYHAAGKPKQKIPEWGGFEVWTRKIRHPLIWAGFPDPCLNRSQIVEDDPAKQKAISVMHRLREHYFGKTFTTSAAAEHKNPALQEALLAVARNRKGEVDTDILGKFLRSWKERVVDGLQLKRSATRKDVALWYVVNEEERRNGFLL
jgi:hypothetical protein